MKKYHSFEESRDEAKKIVDKLGMPIDEWILNLVSALNFVNIETIASCHGHKERGYPYPWVKIRIKSVQKLCIILARANNQMPVEWIIEPKSRYVVRITPRNPDIDLMKMQASANALARFIIRFH